MASLLASLLIKLGLDSADLRSGLSDAERDVRSASQRIAAIGNAMVSTGQKLTMAVTLPMMALGGMAVQGALDQRAAIAQVETAIASMGNVAGRTAEQLAKNADALEMNSLVDADVILTKVTANLLTFGNVAGEVFDRAQQSAIDMAQRMGSDPQAAAVMLGKALNDPIKGITALTRVGVQFTESQKKQIEAFVKTGQVAKAQGIILSEVERQFAGAAKAAADTSPWRQATVAINQTADAFGEALLPILPAVSDLIVGVAQAFGNLSPTMQQTILVAAAVAAAFGPILVGIGSVTVALATRLGPALAAVQVAFWRLVAAQNATSAASIALSIALRGLLIATGVGAVIAGLAAAYYLLTTRTREAVPASAAYSRALEGAQAAAGVAKTASLNLAQALGEERKAALAAASALQWLIGWRLKAAQAQLLQAETEARSAAAAAKRTAATASGGGPGEGIQGRISPSQQRFNDTRRYAGQADANVKAAQRTVIELGKAKAELDRSIATATNPVKLPAVNAAALDAGTAAAGRAGRAVAGIGKAAQEAKAAADELQAIMDRLFPEVAKQRDFEKQLKLIEQSKLTEDQRVAAVAALRREYAGLHRDLAAALPGEDVTKIELTAGGETIEQMSARIDDRFGDVMENLGRKAGATKVQVVKSMQDMVNDVMSAFDRLANSIRSGSFLDIVQSVIGVGMQLGNSGLFGKSFQTHLQKVPGNANGTNNWGGGLSIVGERGPELVNLPRGSQVKTNSELNAIMRERTQRSVVEIVDTTDLFRFRVDGQILQASPAIMDGSARVTTSRAVRKQQRRL